MPASTDPAPAGPAARAAGPAEAPVPHKDNRPNGRSGRHELVLSAPPAHGHGESRVNQPRLVRSVVPRRRRFRADFLSSRRESPRIDTFVARWETSVPRILVVGVAVAICPSKGVVLECRGSPTGHPLGLLFVQFGIGKWKIHKKVSFPWLSDLFLNPDKPLNLLWVTRIWLKSPCQHLNDPRFESSAPENTTSGTSTCPYPGISSLS